MVELSLAPCPLAYRPIKRLFKEGVNMNIVNVLLLAVALVLGGGCVNAPPKPKAPVTISGEVPFIGDYPLKIHLIEYAQTFRGERWMETYEWFVYSDRLMTKFVRSGEFTAYHSNFTSTPVIPLYYQVGEGGVVNVRMPPLETIDQLGYLTGIVQKTSDPKRPVMVYLVDPTKESETKTGE